jgi:MazG family protein
LLQILLHSKIAEENKYFSIVDVVSNLQEKLIKRHPHVFGDVELESAEDVEKQWEEIKKQENSDSIFDDIDQKLPSITKAFKTQRKAKKLDLNYQEALQDLLSEVEELKEAQNDEDRKSEIGDILFSVVNICRYLEADPEIQLNKSTQRFIERAKYVEKNIDPSIAIETLWEEAKKSQLK